MSSSMGQLGAAGARPSLAVALLLSGAAPVGGGAHAQQSDPIPGVALPTAAAPLVFDGVTVIDVERGRRLSGQRVVIVGNRIRQLGAVAAVPLPAGARMVDARGKYLIPGLWDMHVHPDGYVATTYPLFIAHGVTGVRDAGSSVPLATLGRWKREIAAGTRVGPRLIVSGPSLLGPRGDTVHVRPGTTGFDAHMLRVPLAAVPRVVDSLKAAGADMLKMYSSGSREHRLALIAVARRAGMPFGGHSYNMPGPEFSDSGATILDHQLWADPPDVCRAKTFNAAQCAAVARRLRQNHTWILRNGSGLGPSFEAVDYFRRYKPHSLQAANCMVARLDSLVVAFRDVHAPRSMAEWEAQGGGVDPAARARQDSLRHYGATLPVLAGTDAGMKNVVFKRPMGFTLSWTLVRYVADGMTPLEALQTATLHPAQALRATDSLGTVAAGKVADLMLLDADPLEDIFHTQRIRGVVANGRYYDRAALDRLLREVERLAAVKLPADSVVAAGNGRACPGAGD